jgi:hypothetical protein
VNVKTQKELTKQSPLFKHGVESFEHGLEHYLNGSERSCKFAILHIDQAIELFLKEKVVQLGKTIYKSDGSTLNLHETFNSLKDLTIQARPRLEELHDLRNTIQHKGLTPDSGTTQFYVVVAYSFVKKFVESELDISPDQILSPKHRALMQGRPLDGSETVQQAFDHALKASSPSERILMGYTALNRAIALVEDTSLGKPGFRRAFRQMAKERGVAREHVESLLDAVLNLRNKVVHSAYTPSEADANSFLDSARRLLKLARCVT